MVISRNDFIRARAAPKAVENCCPKCARLLTFSIQKNCGVIERCTSLGGWLSTFGSRILLVPNWVVWVALSDCCRVRQWIEISRRQLCSILNCCAGNRVVGLCKLLSDGSFFPSFLSPVFQYPVFNLRFKYVSCAKTPFPQKSLRRHSGSVIDRRVLR